MVEGYADFDGFQTWYRIDGDLRPGDPDVPAPLVILHGGPGATHEYLLALTDLAHDGRAVVLYDQLGNGNSTHLRERGADFWTVDLFVRELTNLVQHLGIGDRFHVLGQSWGGFLAQEYAFTQPPGLRSLVISNSAASFPDFVSVANELRKELPPGVDDTLRKHEDAGTTDDPEYAAACDVFYRRHLLRIDPWPDPVANSFAQIDADPTVYHTMNGPSEFHVIGSIKDWTSKGRLHLVEPPTLLLCGRFDEAAPVLQVPLLEGIKGSTLHVFEEGSHLPMWEQRQEYMSVVDEFLAAND